MRICLIILSRSAAPWENKFLCRPRAFKDSKDLLKLGRRVPVEQCSHTAVKDTANEVWRYKTEIGTIGIGKLKVLK